MKIPHWFCWDYLTQYHGEKDQSYFDAYTIIQAIKGKEFNGFLRVKFEDNRIVDYYHKDSESIAQVILEHVGLNLLPLIVSQDIDLMPIPNSDMIPNSGSDHKIIQSVQKILGAYHSVKQPFSVRLNPGLRWISPKTPSHQNPGSRSMLHYEGKLALTTADPRPIILFDDVYTSGSQAKAATKFLTEQGHTVLGVLTLAKTTNMPRAHAYEWRQEVCEYDDRPFSWENF